MCVSIGAMGTDTNIYHHPNRASRSAAAFWRVSA